MGTDLREIGLRVAAVEGELVGNGESTGASTPRDAIDRIDRRSRKVAESVGALDYDDEVEGHMVRRPPAPPGRETAGDSCVSPAVDP